MTRYIEVRVLGDASSLRAAFGQGAADARTFEARMKAIGASTTSIGRSMTRDLTLPIVAVAAASAKMAIDFQRQMLLLQTQAGASAGQVKQLSAAVLNLAKTAPQGPEQLAQGLYHLVSVGLKPGAQAMAVLKTSSDAAGMGMADLETVTSALGAAVVSGIKGSQNYDKAMGTLNATIGAGNMRMEDLAGSLGNVVGVAKAVGISLPELGASMAVLTDRGMGAEQAATRLRMTFALMERPSKAASKALADLGISETQLAETIRNQGLGAALELLQAAMQRVGDKTRATQDILGAFGGGRSGTAALTLIESLSSATSSYGEKLDLINRKSGQFSKDVAAYHESAAYKISAAWSSIQADMIRAGASLAPIAAELAGDLAKVADAFDSLSPGEKKALADLAALLAVVGPGLLIFGKLAKAIAGITVAAKALGLASATAEIEAAGATAATAATEVGGLRAALLGLGAPEVLAAIAAAYGGFKLGEWLGGKIKGAPATFQQGAAATTATSTGSDLFGSPFDAFTSGVAGYQARNKSPLAGLPAGFAVGAQAQMPVKGYFSPKQLQNMAVAAAIQHGVPVDTFLAQINQESGWNPYALSKAGAQGIAQFMPGTAKGLGINPKDPRQALPAAAGMMANLYKKYGDWGLALAAYNAGSRTVDKFVAGKGTLPMETINYVHAITGAYPNAGTGPLGPIGGGAGGSTKKGPAYKIPTALSDNIAKRWAQFEKSTTKHNEQAYLDAVAEAEKLAKEHGLSTAPYIADISRAQKKLATHIGALQAAAAKAAIADIETKSTGPAQALALAQAAGLPTTEILSDQQRLLAAYQAEAKQLAARLKASTGKAKSEYATALSKIRDKISQTQDAVVQSMQSLVQTAGQKLQSAAQAVASDITSRFEQQTQSYIDTVIGPKYYQGTDPLTGAPLQTPLEAQLAQMQQADQKQQLIDQLNAAEQTQQQDALPGSGAPTGYAAADQKAVDDAKRALQEFDLSIEATRQREKADADDAAAVKKWQDERNVEEQKLTDQLTSWVNGLTDGTSKLTDLNGIAASFGVTLAGLDDPKTGLGYHFGNLETAAKALADALIAEVKELAGIGDLAGAAASGLDSLIAALGQPVPNLGSGGSGSRFQIKPLASGGIVTAPTIALVGEAGPEAVIPLDSAGIGGSQRIEVPVNLNGRELARLVAQHVSRDRMAGRAFAKGIAPHLPKIVEVSK